MLWIKRVSVKNTIAILITYVLTACGGGGSNTNSNEVENSPPEQTNSAPVAILDSLVIEDGTITTINVLDNDTDSDTDQLNIIEIVSPPNFGTATIVDNEIQFVPQTNFAGTDTLVYRISDGELTSDAEVRISLTQSLTLAGRIDGLAGSNATLNVQIGNEVMSFQSDGNGDYEIALTISDSSSLATLNAVDSEQQPIFIGLMGEAKALLDDSGEDRILVAAENTSVNLNLFSTATFLLVEDSNNNQLIESAQRLSDLVSALNTADIVDVAAFMHVLTTNDAFLFTVDPEASTAGVLALLDDDIYPSTQEIIQQYLVNNQLVDELGSPTAEYIAARDEAIVQLSETNLVNHDIAMVISLLQNQTNILVSAQQPGFVADVANSFTLSEEGIGTFFTGFSITDAVPSVPMAWEITNGQLVLSYTQESLTVLSLTSSNLNELRQDFGSEVVDLILDNIFLFPSGQIQQISRITGQDLSLLKQNTNNLQVIAETHSEIELVIPPELGFSDNPTITESSISSFQIPTRIESILIDSEESELLGKWALPVIASFEETFTDNLERGVDAFTLQSNGSSTGEFSGATYDWSLNNGIIVLENPTERYEFLPFKLNGDEYQTIMTRKVNNEIADIQLVLIVRFNDSASQFTDNLVTGLPKVYISHLSATTNPRNWVGNSLRVIQVFAHQFNSDGSMRRAIFTTPSSNNFRFDSALWEIVDGVVQIRKTIDTAIIGRNWQVISVDETGRAHVIETFILNEERIGFPFFTAPRLNSYSLLDLSAYPERFNNTDFMTR